MTLRSPRPNTSPWPRVNTGGTPALPTNWLTIWHSVTSISPISIAKSNSSGTSSMATRPQRMSPANGCVCA